MKVWNYPNIVKLFEVIKTKETLFLIVEHVSCGDRYDYLKNGGLMTKNKA